MLIATVINDCRAQDKTVGVMKLSLYISNLDKTGVVLCPGSNLQVREDTKFRVLKIHLTIL